MSVYLSFSIGPVQTFIAEARRTQDLRFGSYVLAQMAREAIEAIGIEYVIYPEIPDPDQNKKSQRSVAIPNQFMAAFSTVDEAKEAVQAAEEAVKAEWDRVNQAVLSWLYKKGKKLDQKKWTDQVERFPKIYWTIYNAVDVGEDIKSYMYQGQEQDPALGNKRTEYGDTIALVEKALGARKLVRDFNATSDTGRKCSVCGKRAIIGNQAFWKKLTEELYESEIKGGANEQLCAVCMTKRFALQAAYEKENYPSTSSMAAAPFIRAFVEKGLASNESVKNKLETHQYWLNQLKERSKIGKKGEYQFFSIANPFPYLKPKSLIELNPALDLLRWDGNTLFPETFTLTRLKNDYGITNPSPALRAAAHQAETATQELIRAVTTANSTIRPPTPYYAILQMDGDRMGKLLSQAPGREWHKKFSGALADYAHEVVPRIVEKEYMGRLVYAGGDDVLALVGLDQVLLVARDLRVAFLKEIQSVVDEINDKRKPASQIHPDMSGGIAIAHHMTPLDAALRAVRRAEKAAKNNYGRAALVVRLMKRSGVPVQMGMKWASPDLPKEKQAIIVLEELRKAFQNNQLSSRFSQVLFREAPFLAALPNEAQISEIGRLFERHKQETNKEPPIPFTFDAESLFYAMPPKDKSRDKKEQKEPNNDWEANNALESRGEPIQELAKWSKLMQFLASGQEEDA